MNQMGNSSPTAAYNESPGAAAVAGAENVFTIRLACGKTLNGDLLWSAEPPAVLRLAQMLMSEPPDPAAEVSDAHRDAFSELLRQVAGQAATAWKVQSGGEAEFAFQTSAATQSALGRRYAFQIAAENVPEVSLQVALTEELCAALARKPAAPVEAETATHTASALPTNVDLLLDVEIEATIRLGQREMLLRDVCGLMPGVLIELNQGINEPAALHVAGRLIARGEMVVVDGNLGLRVTRVASPSQLTALSRQWISDAAG
jgi:flagellar motor switch protein FliN